MRRFICWLYGDPLPERKIKAPLPSNTLTSPDQLIAAKIVDDFTRNFDKWKIDGDFAIGTTGVRNTSPAKPCDAPVIALTNNKIKVIFEGRAGFDYDWNRWVRRFKGKNPTPVKVNGVPISPEASQFIQDKWEIISGKVAEAKRVAAEALAAQKANEDKWNVAEQLFGIKRDGLGRIVLPQYDEKGKVNG